MVCLRNICINTLHKGDNDDDDDDNNNNSNHNNQVIPTRNYKKYILKLPNIDEMSRCGKESETIQHITAACEQLSPTEYVKRRDGLAKVIHQEPAEAADLIEVKCTYYKYTQASVLENDNFKLNWNRSRLTDKIIMFNRPDITFINKKTK